MTFGNSLAFSGILRDSTFFTREFPVADQLEFRVEFSKLELAPFTLYERAEAVELDTESKEAAGKMPNGELSDVLWKKAPLNEENITKPSRIRIAVLSFMELLKYTNGKGKLYY